MGADLAEAGIVEEGTLGAVSTGTGAAGTIADTYECTRGSKVSCITGALGGVTTLASLSVLGDSFLGIEGENFVALQQGIKAITVTSGGIIILGDTADAIASTGDLPCS